MGLNLHFSVFLYPHLLGEVLWERAVPRFPALCALLCYQKGFRGTEQPKLTPLWDGWQAGSASNTRDATAQTGAHGNGSASAAAPSWIFSAYFLSPKASCRSGGGLCSVLVNDAAFAKVLVKYESVSVLK